MVTQRHTQRLVKWLEEANWIHRQQNHIPFAEGQVFKLRDAWIGFARLTLAMWPFRVALSTWRKNNPETPWEKALQEILANSNAQLKKAVENTIERLRILTSGHENCPVPENAEQLLVWWSMPPPDHSSSELGVGIAHFWQLYLTWTSELGRSSTVRRLQKRALVQIQREDLLRVEGTLWIHGLSEVV